MKKACGRRLSGNNIGRSKESVKLNKNRITLLSAMT
jgi:hypothetical protein